MSSTFKRVLTDEVHNPLAASSAPPARLVQPQILFALLITYAVWLMTTLLLDFDVSEGYISAPPSFSRSQSTGAIFQSARDTLREAQSFSRTHSFSSDAAAQKKRSRAQGDQGYDSDGAVDEERDDTDLTMQDNDGTHRPLAPEGSSRPMKTLRKPRTGMLQTRSLPATAFTMGGKKSTNDVVMNKVEEEEDWSTDNFAPQGFNPIQKLS
ncbi:hypothetical protein H0H87_009040 [Tephrocybe sp. NHM501043]|nr:hypothetical protein H0H87_009040 [Tephrocybe sp. NHM501043]